jgi:uncharacterized protein (DUF302 family)
MVMKKFILTTIAGLFVGSLYVNAGVLGREAVNFDEMEGAPAAGPTLIEKDSKYSVAETVARFTKVIKAKGMTHFATIDHQANAKGAGLTMNKAVVIIFGNPKGGTALMNSDIRMSLALPLKVAVYEGRGGVQLVYRNPASYEADFRVEGSPVISKVTQALDKLTDAAIK